MRVHLFDEPVDSDDDDDSEAGDEAARGRLAAISTSDLITVEEVD